MTCSYEIRKRMSRDIQIVGSEEMDEDKTIYTTGDRLIINKGESSGLKEGDQFIIVAQGDKIRNINRQDEKNNDNKGVTW